MDADDLEMDASDVKVTSVVKTVVVGQAARGLTGQEDFRRENNGTISGAHGEFENIGKCLILLIL